MGLSESFLYLNMKSWILDFTVLENGYLGNQRNKSSFVILWNWITYHREPVYQLEPQSQKAKKLQLKKKNCLVDSLTSRYSNNKCITEA